MSGRRIKEKLAAGEAVFGTFIQYVTHPAIVEGLPDEGLDFVVLNAEHNALDLADFLPLQFALRGKGIACLVRIHDRNPEDVRKACDSFPDGVVVPYVEDIEQLKRLAAAATCRPLQGDTLERLITSGQWPSDKTRDYVQAHCANTLFCPMIESVQAVENLDAICSVPGIDAVFVGPNDLTNSMGIPEERDNPAFIEIVQKIVDVAARHGVAAGAHFAKLSHAKRLIEQGGRFIPFSNDGVLIQAGVAEFLSALRGETTAGKGRII